MFKFILYISRVSDQCGDRQMTDILVTSRSNNAKNSVTGMLVRSDSAFLQYIEGSEDTIDNLFWTIERDNRHHSVKTITEGLIDDRVFFDWEMGFANEDNLQPLQWKWQLDKISMFSLADNASDCLDFVKAFLATPDLAHNLPAT